MADTNGDMRKVEIADGLGKSTLLPKLGLSIPMPQGATPPPADQRSGQVASPQSKVG